MAIEALHLAKAARTLQQKMKTSAKNALPTALEDLDVRSFDAQAILLKFRGTKQMASRQAPLGLLLNRVKRMLISKGTRIEIVYGETVYDRGSIASLLSSPAYHRWLAAPPRRRSREEQLH